MDRNYDAALKRVLAHEGGYSNHPSDPGGPTNFGITLADYRRYVKAGATAADVRSMRLEDAKTIYRQKYWLALGCNELPAGLDYSMFDYGVNSGIGRAGKVLRRLVGLPDNTWTVTDQVLAAVAKRDPKQLISRLNDERIGFLRRLSTWPVFGAGWGRRVTEVRAYSLKLADQPNTPVTPLPAPADSGKGRVPEPKGAKTGTDVGAPAAGIGLIVAFKDWVVAHPGATVFMVVAAVAVVVAVRILITRRHAAKQETPLPVEPVPVLQGVA